MRWIFQNALFFLILTSAAVAETNVILVTVDSLRADHLETYGYERLKTPAISALANEGVTFDRAIVQTPLGMPSHASILTGTYPPFHGLEDVVGKLRSDVPTLAEWFRDQNYETAAFVGSAILLSQWGLNRGFQTYDDYFSTSTNRPTDFDRVRRQAESVVRLAVDWLDGRSGKPFFLWLNFSDPSEPCAPPAPFSVDFASSPYDGEIAYVDSMLSQLIGSLKEKKLYENSLILLTAPHGTALGEHGEDSHGLFLYQTCLHVPFILKLPNGKLSVANGETSSDLQRANIRVSSRVRSVDVAPTVIQLLGGQVPEFMQGRSLLGFLTTAETVSELPAYSETHYPRLRFGWSSLFSYSSGQYKFIGAPIPELYDLEADPAELENIYEKKKALAEQMNVELGEFRTSLKSRSSQAEPSSDLADPKTKMEVYGEINGSFAASRSGQSDKALTTMRKVLQKEPKNPAAHFLVGSEYLDRGQYLLAVQEFSEGLKHSPNSYENKVNLALSYLRAGLNGKAQQILRGILEANPADAVARQFLAISYAKQGNLDEAIVHGRKAVELRSLSASANYNLASYYLRSGRDIEAAEYFKRLIEIAPAHLEGRANFSFVLLRLGRIDEALQQAMEAVRLAPDYSLGYFYLGQAYQAKGMGSEAEAAFRKAKELDSK